MSPDDRPRRTMSQLTREEKSNSTNFKTVPSDYRWIPSKGDMDLIPELLCNRALCEGPVYFKGDVIITDPFKIFFTNDHFLNTKEELLERCKELGKRLRNFVITYKGIESVFVTSPFWEDQYAAFEVVRKGTTVGVQETQSNIIAAIPLKLVDLCIEEGSCDLSSNFDKRAALQKEGVICEDVDGEFLSSNDGDFVFSRQTSCPESAKLSEWIQEEHPNKYADVLCATGGCWTFPDDSSSDGSEGSLIFDATEEDNDVVMKAMKSEQEMDSYIRAVSKISIQDPDHQLQVSPKLS